MEIIDTLKMPKNNGHYSQCIQHNGVLYASGQLPIDSFQANPKNDRRADRFGICKI